jgi:hypothetical protein
MTDPHPVQRTSHLDDADVIRGLTSELNATLERARDERFRLLRLIKDAPTANAAPLGAGRGAGGLPDPQDIDRLAERVDALTATLQEREQELAATETVFQRRLDQLRRLEGGIRELTDQFARQVAAARSFEDELAVARGRIREEVDAVLTEVREHIGEECQELSQALDQADASGRSLREQQMEADRVVQQAGAAMQRQLSRAMHDFEAQAGVCADAAVAAIEGRLDQAMRERIETHRAALAEEESKLAAELSNRVAAMRSGSEAAVAAAADEAVARLASETARVGDELARSFDATVQRTAEAAEATVLQRLSEATAACEAKGDVFIETLQSRIDASFDQVACEADNVAARMQHALAELKEQSQNDAAAILDEARKRVRERIVEAMGQSTQVVDALQQRVASVLDTHRDQLEATAASLRDGIDERVLQWNESLVTAAASVERKAGELIARFERDAEAAMAPLGERVAARVAALRERCDEEIARMLDAADGRIADAQEDAEQQVREAEEQLARRILAMKPQTDAELQSLEEQVRERVDALTRQMRNEVDERVSPLNRQTMEELQRLAERTHQVRQLMASLRPTQGPGAVDMAAIVDPQRTLDALDKLARRLGYRIEPTAPARAAEAQQAA